MKYFIVLISFYLTACGNDSTNNSITWPPYNENQIPDAYGILVDSPVQGLRYISGIHYGVTDLNGQFGYLSGENIQFYLGSIPIGEPLPPSKRLTPYNLANGDPFTAINIARFLQTIDNDSILENGIQINEATHNSASNASLNFSSLAWQENLITTSALQAERSEIENLTYRLTSNTDSGSRYLIPALDAYLHLRATLDTLIDALVDEANDIAYQSTCDNNDQCVIVELTNKGTSSTQTKGPLITYSNTTIDQAALDVVISDRASLIQSMSDVEYAIYNANFDMTQVTLGGPLLVCNITNHCEILGYEMQY